MTTRYFISLPDPERARGEDDRFSFTANGADGFAEQLQRALRDPSVHERWRAAQDDPDNVDEALAATDPNARVTGKQDDLHVDLEVTSDIPSAVLQHRLRLLAGNAWQLRDVRKA